MKYAILSDVHANPKAFQAVLADAREQGVEKTLCLGDVVGYGPNAKEAVRIAQEEVDTCLMGNHDAAVAGVITGEGFSLPALRGVGRHREETSEEEKAWLAGLEYVYADGDMACAHGDFSEPRAFRYVMGQEDVPPSLKARRESVLFVGHTHAASTFACDKTGAIRGLPTEDEIRLEDGCRYVVNVGSVGYPRREIDTTYCLYDSEAKTVRFRRLPFDFDGYEKEMQKAGETLPRWFGTLKRESEARRPQRKTLWSRLAGWIGPKRTARDDEPR